jgi:hypothetical protein
MCFPLLGRLLSALRYVHFEITWSQPVCSTAQDRTPANPVCSAFKALCETVEAVIT